MQKTLQHVLTNLRFIDLTHPLNNEVRTWDGSCGFKSEYISYFPDGKGPLAERFSFIGGAGTHMDAPTHFLKGAQTVTDFAIENSILPCAVINVSDRSHESYTLSVDDIKEFEAKNGTITQNSLVLVYTGWSQYWADQEKYLNNLAFPSFSPEAAQFLLDERQISGIGIDTMAPDCPPNGFPVHQILLGAHKLIVENVAYLDKITQPFIHVIVAPLKIENGTEAPIRLIGLI